MDETVGPGVLFKTAWCVFSKVDMEFNYVKYLNINTRTAQGFPK